MKKKFKDISSNSFKKKNVKLKKKGFGFFGFKNKNDRFKNISSNKGGSFFSKGGGSDSSGGGPLKASFRFGRIVAIVFKIIICLTLFLIIGLSIVVTGLTVYLMKASDGQFSVKLDRESLMDSATTVVMGVDDDGKYIQVGGVSTGVRGIWTDLKNVPLNLQNAFVAIEDRQFYDHQGVNWMRTFAASANFVLKFWDNNQGGSTITQQLVKNLTNDKASSGAAGATRKLREVYRALNVERCCSKDQILQAYLNIVHVGGKYGNFKGVGIAARLYFNKDISDLNLAECASIAALVRNPVFYDPIKNEKNNKPRRDKVLKNMLNLGYINRDDYEKAINTPIKTNQAKNKHKINKVSNQSINNHQSYFVDSVLNQVVSDYMKLKKISDWDKANEEIKNGGFKIYSTIDFKVQNELEKIFTKPSNFGCKSFENKPKAACVVYDFNGNMKACVGNLGKKHAGDRADLNFATSVINPGSSNKPFIYAMAIKNNMLTYSSIVDDEPVKKVEDRDWPKNFDEKYHGKVTVEYALENSLNTVPVKIAKKLGVESICNFLTNGLKFSTIYPPSRPYDRKTFESEAIAIGSMTKGVKLNELANAYQIFGNGGYFTPSTTYEKVCSGSGEVLLEPKHEPVRVLDVGTSVVLNRLLRRVITNGTGRVANLDALGIEVVGKTGTSDDEKSLSFIGLIPPTAAGASDGRIVGVWIGGPGLMKPVELFKMVCSKLFKNTAGGKKRSFDHLKRFVDEANFCKQSGQLAGANCPSRVLETGYYRKNRLPDLCQVH